MAIRFYADKPESGVAHTDQRHKTIKQSDFPPGWDEERVRRLLAHYEEQTEDEAVVEDEVAAS